MPTPHAGEASLQINIVYDSSANSAPAAFKTAVAYVVNLLDAAFTNNVTLNIHVGWGEVNGSPITSNDLGESEEAEAPRYDYATIRDALIANGTAADQLAAFDDAADIGSDQWRRVRHRPRRSQGARPDRRQR